MPERRFELTEIHRRRGLPAPSERVLASLLDIVDEGVLGATNHVALALPLVAGVAAEARDTALAEALELARFLARTRGAAAPIVANALAWQTGGIEEGQPRETAAALLAERAREWDDKAAQRRQLLIARAREALEGRRAPLIFDYSSTVADLVRALALGPGLDGLVVPESRAIDGGRRYLAALSGLGLPVRFLPDAALDYAAGQADVVLLGAESVTLDGGVVNTIGSTGAARAAAARGVPVFGAADLFKVGPLRAAELPPHPLRSYPFLLREGEAADTSAPELEVVPPALLTALLTEVGPIAPGDIAAALPRRAAGSAGPEAAP